jgi:cytoskeleton protein RodZ
MSAQPAIDRDDQVPVGHAEGPGRRLRAARQARKLELERVANLLHLKPSLVAALEQDNYDALPGSVFVLGYVRNYARLLNLDPEPLLAQLRRSEPQPAEPVRARPPRRARRQMGSGHLLVRLVTLTVVAAVAGLSFVWWQNQRPNPYQELASGVSVSGNLDLAAAEVDSEPAPDAGPAAAAAEPQTEAEPVPAVAAAMPPPAEPASVPPAAPLFDPAGASGGLAADELALEPVEAPPPPEDAAPVVAMVDPAATTLTGDETEAAGPAASNAEADAATGAEGVVMEFTGPCWVDIRDSERRFKIFGEMGAGDRRVLEGTPPYSVILGNAAAVRITVAGEPFDLEGIARGNVARFTLDPERLP